MRENDIITLSEKSQLLDEVVVVPRNFRERTFGVNTSSPMIQTGFSQNALGYELGLLMRNRRMAILQSVNVNVASIAYDTVFFRLNVYEQRGRMDFENILIEPIYVTVSREKVLKTNSLQIDLTDRNIVVNGNFLVTLEHIKDLGDDGGLFFPANLRHRTHFRRTSQGSWETGPVGIALSVTALVER